MKFVSMDEIREVFAKVRKGADVVHVVFNRQLPKCLICGKTYSKEELPVNNQCCGAELSFVTYDICKFGVTNPGPGITAPGTGKRKGMTADEAFDKGIVKYYSNTRIGDRADGQIGGYRQFKIENLVEATIDNEIFLVNKLRK